MTLLKPFPGSDENSASLNPKGAGRRKFIRGLGGAAAASIAMSAASFGAAGGAAGAQSNSTSSSGSSGSTRAQQSFQNRVNAAHAELNVPAPQQITNGDEQRYPNRIGNYSKGLLHNNIGEVEPASYQSFLKAVRSGEPQDFEQIQLGGNTPLVDPQSGLAFDLEGTDCHQLAIGTPPAVASRQMADTAVENYWMALCRDVNFTQYGNEPLTQAAIAELNSLPAFPARRHAAKPFSRIYARRCPRPLPITVHSATPYLRRDSHHPDDDDVRCRPRLHDRSVFLARRAEWPGPFAANQPDPNIQHFATAAA